MSKFNFKTSFLESLNEILDKREEALKANLEANYAHIDDVPFKEDIESKIESIDYIVSRSELEYFDLSEFVQRDEILLTHSKEDLLTRIKELEDDNRELESRLLVIENFLLKTLKGFKDD